MVKCQSCSYEKEIHSSGAHVTEGGSVMVYDTTDEFSCPNCDVNNDNLFETMENVEETGKIIEVAFTLSEIIFVK